jgi:hypothetical protein
MYFEHLQALCLVVHNKDITVIPPEGKLESAGYRWYSITSFGSRFLEICGQPGAKILSTLGKSV